LSESRRRCELIVFMRWKRLRLESRRDSVQQPRVGPRQRAGPTLGRRKNTINPGRGCGPRNAGRHPGAWGWSGSSLPAGMGLSQGDIAATPAGLIDIGCVTRGWRRPLGRANPGLLDGIPSGFGEVGKRYPAGGI